MTFGSYALFSIGRELAILKDYPEENEKLLKEIEASKKFYKEKGAKID